MATTTQGAKLRQQLAEGFVLAPGVYNGMFAKLVEDRGFDAVYMTGFGTAARFGVPDIGLITQSEMVANVRSISRAVSIPLIADADTGYGNEINVDRTVRLWEGAGAATLHIEDQVFPKRCGFMSGKEVIPIADAVSKIRTAVDSRDDIVVIARTDSLAPHGWDEAVKRCEAFADAGADLVFVDGVRTRDDLETYADRVVDAGLASLYNGTIVGPAEAAEMGFGIQIIAGLALGAAHSAAVATMSQLRDEKSVTNVLGSAITSDDRDAMNRLLGVDEAFEFERRYATTGARS